ncbi:uncharacterized protein LOC127727998 [Mytilus californianus]|uniref:uncharacterized protein LOC127727998 n=1 Tax=Mytilus californianus TaxID=6549 RepID=UPI0022457C20|nr:uncharacterized protein LOC127727998 [Mytilus californianus]
MKAFHTSVFIMAIFTTVFAVKEHPISVSDTGEGTACDTDMEVANTCLACSRINQDIAVRITDCCTESKAYTVCQICTKDPSGCLEDARSISSDEYIDDGSSEETEVDKRYGRMFMGGWSYPGRQDKRYGKMFVGGGYPGRSFLFGKRMNKRFGRVFSNGYGYPYRSPSTKFGKRFGRLFTSQTGGNKRYGSLFLGKSRW